jgi:chromosome segregation ATPase
MSDILEKQVAELKEQVKSLQATNKELQDDLSNASVEKYEAEIASLREKLATVEAEYMEDKKKKKKMDEDMKASEEALAAAQKEAAETRTQLESLKAELTKAARVSKLVEAGFDKADAEAKAAEFANLNDEQFASLASTFATILEKAKAAPQEKSDDETAAEAETTLASAEEEDTDVDASIDDSDSENEKRQELFAAVASRFEEQWFNTKENK